MPEADGVQLLCMQLRNSTQLARALRLTYTIASDAFSGSAACIWRPGSFHIAMFESGRFSDLTRLPLGSTAGCS
jgi:hypothetical protein